jgi:hypothetical protein
MMSENTLYFGDNLKILRDNIRDETVDLIYLDPLWGSSPIVREASDERANYNVLFHSPKGHRYHDLI